MGNDMENEKTRHPYGHLTFVIRDTAPFQVLEEPVTHRTVRIDLTPEQREKLLMFATGQSGGKEIWESISCVYWEPTLCKDVSAAGLTGV